MAQSALIKITVDPSKSIVTINGVTVALNQLEKAQKKVTGAIKDNDEAIEGSLKWHKMQVQKLNAVREATSTNSEEYDKATLAIKKHNMAIAEITQNKELERGAIKGSFQDYENQIAALRRQQKQFADNNVAVLEYEKRIQSLRASQRALTTGTKLTGKGMQSMSSSAGLAGAAATEFGRAVGDAQYGIQGVSNNLQQLSALFTDLVQQEGSVKKAFDLFKSTLMGPAGVLVAVSLVTTAIEFFVRRQNEAKKAVENFNEAVFLETGALTILAKKYKDQDTSDENRIQMLYQLALANQAVRNIITDETLTLDQRIKKGEQFIDNQLALNEAQEELAKVTNFLNEAEADAIPTTEEYLAAKAKLNEIAGETDATMRSLGGVGYTVVEDKGRAAAETTIALFEAQEKQGELSAKIIGLQDTLNYLTEDGNKKKEKERAIVKNSIRDYEKRIEKLKEELVNVDLNSAAYKKMAAQLKVLETEYEQLKLTYSELIEEYLRGREAFDEMAQEEADSRHSAIMSHMDYLLRKKDLEDQESANQELSLEERLSLQIGSNKERLKAAREFLDREKELERSGFQIQRDSINERIGMLEGFLRREDLTDEERLKLKERLQKEIERLNKLERDDAKKTADEIIKEAERKNQELIKTLGNIKDIASTINDFMESEAQREIDIETNKTNAINEQLRERLRNEQLSKEQRDQINQEIARNEAALVEKENAINEKRFNQAKAFNIAMAVIDTYVAANQALKDTTLVSTFAKVAAMVSIIGTGLANVASIARQQFVGRVAKSPTLRGDGAPSGGDRVFNVVGAAPQTQIAEAIAAVEEKPVKAYVVSSEVTSAQELDRRIVEGASI